MAKLLMTLDELIEKAGEGDPLYDEPEQLEKIGDNVLIIRGHDDDKGYADDLKITINENSLTMHYKEPGEPDTDDFWEYGITTCDDCTEPCACVNAVAYSI